jgi:pimeloyl-ACP methyl ester carboxylesterase
MYRKIQRLKSFQLKNVYFISGLGADKRAFNFLDLSFCNPIFIDWMQPLPKETLKQYALRMYQQITDENPVIVGLSFGGMLTTEMANANPNVKAIIISSNKLPTEFPRLLKIGKVFPAYKWVSGNFNKKFNQTFSWFLGVKGTEQRKIRQDLIRDSDPKFTKWAIEAILHWDNKTIPQNIVHIHGTADKLLPYRYVKADYTIKDGEHLMVMDRPEEISALLKQLIMG